MNLIILTEADAIADTRYHLADHRAEHIRTILKAKPGDTVEVGLLNGPVGIARIGSLSSGSIELVCEQLDERPSPTPQVDLICALPRPQTLKKILITSAMMGVHSLQLVRANRVEKSYFQSPLIEPENQLPYLIEGLAQGKLTRLPQVTVHDRFRPFFEDRIDSLTTGIGTGSTRLLCSLDHTEHLGDVWPASTPQLTLAIGPEGGWVPFEIDLMQSVGFKPFSLGRWILRVEHAVTSALSQLELLRNSRL